METIIINIKLIQDTPNDMELGKKVRELLIQQENGEKDNTK